MRFIGRLLGNKRALSHTDNLNVVKLNLKTIGET